MMTIIDKIISRQDAAHTGLKKYFTGKPCGYGHLVGRYTKSGMCVGCIAAIYNDGKLTPVFNKVKNAAIIPATHAAKKFKVYAISASDFIKIGVAQSIPARLTQIKVNCPHTPKIEWVSKPTTKLLARRLERAALEKFRTKYSHGEWVKASSKDVVSFLTQGYSDTHRGLNHASRNI